MRKKTYLGLAAALLLTLIGVGFSQKGSFENTDSSDLEARVAKLEATVQRLSSDVYWLRNKVDGHERDIPFMKMDIDNLKFSAHRH